MGCDVYANGHEIACKASGHKVIAEFPDVCLSPPSPPAGPIPVPYPNTSFAKDMKQGSKTVKIGKKEGMLKDKSFYKSSPLGDEAATRSFGANVLSHTITGKTHFVAWSTDVKLEGYNVDRNVDLTTSNHASMPGGTGPLTVSLAEMALAKKADAKWGHKRGKSCGDNHVWECDKAECGNCWNPPCDVNAAATNSEYRKTQSGTNQEKAQKAKAAKQKKIDKAKKRGGNDSGSQLEIDVIDKLGEENIELVDYKAHCRNCHLVADIDIVTADSVIEVKKSKKVLKRKQMTQRVMSVAQQCFPGKTVKVATGEKGLAGIEKTLQEKEWRNLGIDAFDP